MGELKLNTYMDTKECAEYLRTTPGTVHQWVCRGKIPHLRANDKLLFSRQAIDEWLVPKPVAQSKFRELQSRIRSLKSEVPAGRQGEDL